MCACLLWPACACPHACVTHTVCVPAYHVACMACVCLPHARALTYAHAPWAPHAGPGTSTAAAAPRSALRAAQLLENLTAWQAGSVDEMDYERRLEGYKALVGSQWAALGRRKVRGRNPR